MIEIHNEDSLLESVETGWNSGGHVYLDTIKLKDGTILVISGELICLHKNQQCFDDGEDPIGILSRPDEDINDMFKTPSLIPHDVAFILNNYNDSEDYEMLDKCIKELNKIGWTFDYGLDAVPFNLRKL